MTQKHNTICLQHMVFK